MSIYINVVNQKMHASSNVDDLVSGSQRFVKFKFNLSEEWDGLMTFAQFKQGQEAYNEYLDNDNCVYLPPEIGAGTCTLMLYGSYDKTIGTTNYLTLKITENALVSDVSSTEISQSLYNQLVDMVKTSGSGKFFDVETIGIDSHAEGKETISGCEGYYVKAIDVENRKIYLTTSEQTPSWDSADFSSDISEDLSSAVIGQKFSVQANGYYQWVRVATISAIEDNAIVYTEQITPGQAEWEGTSGRILQPAILFVDECPDFGAVPIGHAAHAEGWKTHAAADETHAEGYATKALGPYTHSEGLGTIATANAQHVQGKYNIEDTENKYVHIVGNGSSSERSNAHTLDWDGNAWYASDVQAGDVSLKALNTQAVKTINGTTPDENGNVTVESDTYMVKVDLTYDEETGDEVYTAVDFNWDELVAAVKADKYVFCCVTNVAMRKEGYDVVSDYPLQYLSNEECCCYFVSPTNVGQETLSIYADGRVEYDYFRYDANCVKTVNGATPDENGNVQIETGGSAEGAVLYTEQTLTPEQQAQARANIGAVDVVINNQVNNAKEQANAALDKATDLEGQLERKKEYDNYYNSMWVCKDFTGGSISIEGVQLHQNFSFFTTLNAMQYGEGVPSLTNPREFIEYPSNITFVLSDDYSSSVYTADIGRQYGGNIDWSRGKFLSTSQLVWLDTSKIYQNASGQIYTSASEQGWNMTYQTALYSPVLCNKLNNVKKTVLGKPINYKDSFYASAYNIYFLMDGTLEEIKAALTNVCFWIPTRTSKSTDIGCIVPKTIDSDEIDNCSLYVSIYDTETEEELADISTQVDYQKHLSYYIEELEERVDGAETELDGTVKSVNGTTPDKNGNVDVESDCYIVKVNRTVGEDGEDIYTTRDFNWGELRDAVIVGKNVFCRVYDVEASEEDGFTIADDFNTLDRFTDEENYVRFTRSEETITETIMIYADGTMERTHNDHKPTGITKTLLWQNASPTSSFAPQSIVINNRKNYQEVEIEFASNRSVGSPLMRQNVSVAQNAFRSGIIYLPSNPNMYGRRFDEIFSNDVLTSIQFRPVSINGSENGNLIEVLVPYRIYGIEGVQ